MGSMQLKIDFENNDKNILEDLNKKQREAVEYKSGPLLIIAGAGTGKTTVITRRIAHLIDQHLALPSEILALTFTEKAASEMEERVDQLVPYGFVDIWISTFHAFGDRLLRDYSLDLGLPLNFKILTQAEQAIFIRENLFAFNLKYYLPLSNPTGHISALLNHFSRLKDELITPDEYYDYAKKKLSKSKIKVEINESEKILELADAYARYSNLMIQAGNLDFGDLIFLTYRLLKDNPKILQECRNKFKYILVDEFQDTNYAQNEIVKFLAGKNGNITVVGDDDQSIYRFRGASISNIMDFKKSYPKSKEIVLIENYRSSQEILDSSYKLIQHNNPDRLEVQNKINKRLISNKHGKMPELKYEETLSLETDGVAETILSLRKKSGYGFSDFAILVRANSQAEPFIQALNIMSIPYIFSGASNLYDRQEIKMLISFFRILINLGDNLSLYSLATSELYNIAPSLLSEYYIRSKKNNRPVISLIRSDAKSTARPDETIIGLSSDVCSFQSKMRDLNAGELLYQYLVSKDYLKKLSRSNEYEDEIKLKNIAKFFERISEFNNISNQKNVISFLENLEMLLEAGDEISVSEIDPDIDAVNILTVHSAKGLEWKVVFIVNLTSERFPARKKKESLPIPGELIKEKLPIGDFHLEEERRLFYVAATRAKELLYLTFADDYGGKRKKKISQFVLEILDDPNIIKNRNKASFMEKIEKFNKGPELALMPRRFTLDNIKLSRLQIDDYYTCPKKFYYSHIIRIPLLENQALMFGIAIHSAINHHLARKMRKEETNLSLIMDDYKEAFRNVGFISVEHEKKRFEAGLDAIKLFYNDDKKEGMTPLAQETSFDFIVDGTTIIGRYDAIYKHGKEIEIRDFKTSDVKTEEDADRRIKESTQMKIYALSYLTKFNVIPKTTLYFIESGVRGEAVFRIDEIEKTREMIREVVTGIKKNVLTAKPDFFSCRYCPFNTICPDSVAR